MLQQIFEALGFFPTLFFVLASFFAFIFWLAGIAGILQANEGKPVKENMMIFVCILLPPYPVIWLLIDIVRQAGRIKMKKRNSA
ncbi:MAG: hypothetical protein ACOC2C_03615 [Cyclonatronaceae bacterium]